MAEPDLNVDSLIQRLLEGKYYMFTLFLGTLLWLSQYPKRE